MSNKFKKTNGKFQRAELHRKIWAIADDVRGAVDGWDFKQYILGILFYRFISENMIEFFNSAEHEAGDLDFDYTKISDEEAELDFRPDTVKDKGFFILPSQLFNNVVKDARNNESILWNEWNRCIDRVWLQCRYNKFCVNYDFVTWDILRNVTYRC